MRKLLLATMLVAATTSVIATTNNNSLDTAGFVVYKADQMQWQKGPAALPKGAQMAVLAGNPMESGPFTIRLKLPANYMVAPHTHPGFEQVTVISGTFNLGTDMSADAKNKAEHAITAGGFFALKPNHPHKAWTGAQGAVIQINGIGPWSIDYLDEKNDPRKM